MARTERPPTFQAVVAIESRPRRLNRAKSNGDSPHGRPLPSFALLQASLAAVGKEETTMQQHARL